MNAQEIEAARTEYEQRIAEAVEVADHSSAAYFHSRTLAVVWDGMNPATRLALAEQAPALAEHLDGLAAAWIGPHDREGQ